MSVKYNEHTVITDVDPDADWNPMWDTSGSRAARASINNTIKNATFPGAGIPIGSLALTKLESQAASTLLGRPSGSTGAPQAITLAAQFNITAGGILQLTGSFQPSDPDLTAIAALTTNGFGRSLLTVGNAAGLRTVAELLTPTGWLTTDKLVTTQGNTMLVDVGALNALSIVPVSSATNVQITLQPKGTGYVYLVTPDETSLGLGPGAAAIAVTGFLSADFATRHLTDATEKIAVNWLTRELLDADGVTTVVDWDNLSLVGAWSIGGITTQKIASTWQAVTLAAAATTFQANSSSVALTGDAGANTLATITGGAEGMELSLFFVDALITITDTAAATANTINLSAAFTGSANDVLTLIYRSGKWFEKSRSVN